MIRYIAHGIYLLAVHKMQCLKYFILFTVLSQTLAQDCLSRDYGNGGTVCVCNAEHCDTVEPVTSIEKSSYIVYTTNKAGLRFSKKTNQFAAGQDEYENKITVGEKGYQKILGFGGALTDSTGLNILSLNKSVQEKLLRSYFSDQGIEYNLCRVPIGGSDFSTRRYSYHDDVEDASLPNFKLQDEDYKYKIPLIKRAAAYRDNLQLFASAWTAPKWMKVHSLPAGPFGYLKKKYYQAWADYHVKFLDAYAKENITFWGMTTGNEPFTGLLPVPIPSVGWTSERQRVWIAENLGPAVRNSSHSNTKLIALDDQRIFLPGYVKTLFENEAVEKYIDGIAVHWYADRLVSSKKLTETHDAFPGKFMLGTEASLGAIPLLPHVVLGSWERAERYAFDIMDDINNYVGGWVDWNMVLDVEGGPTYISNFLDSAIIVNATAGEFYKQPYFYVIGHFSKFVPKRSVRIEVTHTDKDLTVTAFRRPDNGTVLVILNTTNKSKNVTVTTGDARKLNADLTDHSLTTILYW